MEVSTADLAEVLGVGERRIQQLASIGVFRRLAHGEWLLPECIQAYVKHKVESEIGRQGKQVATGADRLKEIKARREELRLAQDERDLVPLSDAIFAMDEVAGLLALEMNNVPARFTRDLAERERLQTEIDAALLKLALCIAKRGAALRADREADPPPEEDDAG